MWSRMIWLNQTQGGNSYLLKSPSVNIFACDSFVKDVIFGSILEWLSGYCLVYIGHFQEHMQVWFTMLVKLFFVDNQKAVGP